MDIVQRQYGEDFNEPEKAEAMLNSEIKVCPRANPCGGLASPERGGSEGGETCALVLVGRVGALVEAVLTRWHWQVILERVNEAQQMDFDDLSEMMQNTTTYVQTFGKMADEDTIATCKEYAPPPPSIGAAFCHAKIRPPLARPLPYLHSLPEHMQLCASLALRSMQLWHCITLAASLPPSPHDHAAPRHPTTHPPAPWQQLDGQGAAHVRGGVDGEPDARQRRGGQGADHVAHPLRGRRDPGVLQHRQEVRPSPLPPHQRTRCSRTVLESTLSIEPLWCFTQMVPQTL